MRELPPAPEPGDFGITETHWIDYRRGEDIGLFYDRDGYKKIHAYLKAVEEWKALSGDANAI